MDANIEIYICTKNGTFISQPFNIWSWRNNYFINAIEEVLNDVVVDFVYRLIKAKKFRKNEIIDIYFNKVNEVTGEIEPLLSYTEYHSHFPDIDINPCFYGDLYESLFDMLLDHPDKNTVIDKKIMKKNKDAFYDSSYNKTDTEFRCRVFPDRDMYLRYLGNNTHLIVIGTDILDNTCVDYINQINEFIKGLPS